MDEDNAAMRIATAATRPARTLTMTVMELRSTMNITRRWAALGPLAPGSYRLSLVYFDSRNTQIPPHTIYSPTFEVR